MALSPSARAALAKHLNDAFKGEISTSDAKPLVTAFVTCLTEQLASIKSNAKGKVPKGLSNFSFKELESKVIDNMNSLISRLMFLLCFIWQLYVVDDDGIGGRKEGVWDLKTIYVVSVKILGRCVCGCGCASRCPNWTPMGLHAPQCADLHGDERCSTKSDKMLSLFVVPCGIHL